MAKFTSIKPDLVVSTDDGYIKFVKGEYTTTKKKEIEALQKALGVKEITAGAKVVTEEKLA